MLILHLLYIVLISRICYAIQCQSNEESTKEKTCTGDVCVNYFENNEKSALKDCITGFNYTGCTTIDKISLCFCNTDNCNSQSIPSNQLTPSVVYNCSDATKTSQTPSEFTKTTTAPLCKVEGREWRDYNNDTSWELTTSGLKKSDAFVLKMNQPQNLIMDMREYFYIGGAYAFAGQSGDFYYTYRCRGNLCNDNFAVTWVPKSKDVTCQRSGSHKDEYTPCEGEFCLFIENSDLPTKNFAYCMNTNQTNSEGKFKVGVYKFKNAVIHICKSDNCNKDATTAKKSIEDYPNGNAKKNPQKDSNTQSEPTTTSVITTTSITTIIPQEDSTQQKPIDNRTVEYCSLNILCFIFMSIYCKMTHQF